MKELSEESRGEFKDLACCCLWDFSKLRGLNAKGIVIKDFGTKFRRENVEGSVNSEDMLPDRER